MAHQQQQDFCLKIKNKFPELFKNCKVLDIGSLDINGNNRYLFENSDYTGIDLSEGNNVSIVSKGHEFMSKTKFDIIISTECLEHDEHWKETLLNAYKLLKKGGLLLFTCATTGREEHGTTDNHSFASPFTNNYYKNLTIIDIEGVFDFTSTFSDYEIIESHNGMDDLYFYGIKK
jgi:cyclopropane fatty-acyl-phospholipid synthase-like methyltransferase